MLDPTPLSIDVPGDRVVGSACAYPSHSPPIRLKLTTLAPTTCHYLPDRFAQLRAFYVPEQMSGALYHRFMDAGFRRSGRVMYQPVCPGCRRCIPLRVPVDRFTADKSMRRCLKRNTDLSVEIRKPELTDETFSLYQRYQAARHPADERDRTSDEQRAALASFLYDSPIETAEFVYRDPEGKLVAVGICDVCPLSISSVYFIFDPDASKRSLGIYSALMEIRLAQQNKIPYWYVGFWVSGCQAMEYKRRFQPCEQLDADGVWR